LANIKVDLIIHHAKQLVTARGHSESPATGSEMENLGILEDGAVAINGGKIVAVGTTSEIMEDYSGSVIVNIRTSFSQVPARMSWS
jgi:imidazolonepropionase-like amidohydrolase